MNFNLKTTYAYTNDIHKSNTIKYKPNNLATMNTVNTNIYPILNREVSQYTRFSSRDRVFCIR